MSRNNNLDIDLDLREPTEGSCKHCNETVHQDELIQCLGYCHRCNPSKVKNLDALFKEVGQGFYEKIIDEIIGTIIKEHKPKDANELDFHFWSSVKEQRLLNNVTSDFALIYNNKKQTLVSQGNIKEAA